METDSSNIIFLVIGLGAVGLLFGFFVYCWEVIRRSRRHNLKSSSFSSIAGSRSARRILAAPDVYLLAAWGGAYMSALASGSLVVVLTGELAGAQSPGLPQPLLSLLILAIVAIAALVSTQIFRALAHANPERGLCLLAPPLVAAVFAIRPVILVVGRLLRPLLGSVGLRMPLERAPVVSVEEISEIVEKSSLAGEIEEDESDLIQGAIQFAEQLVRSVMTPRNDVIAVSCHAELDEVLAVFAAEGFSRLVVIGDELDDVKGLLMAKDLIPLVGKSVESFDVTVLMREVYTVPETKKIDDLLQEFRQNAVHFAVVIDEHGGVAGVVTVEDLLEEIVGDIFDEFDDPAEEASLKETRSGDIIVDGGTDIGELNENYDFNFPEGQYETIAGFVIQQLGRIPEPGEVIEHNGARIQVEGVFQNRVTELRIVNQDSAESGPEEDSRKVG